MNGPAAWFCPLVCCDVRSVRAVGTVPMCAWYIDAADARARISACAFAMRARACTFA